MKRLSLIAAAFVFTSVLFVGVILLPEARATTRYVGGAGPGNYSTVQAAIDDADPGDTVYVYSGTYYEHVIVNKTLSLVGEDRNTTFVDASWVGDAIYVSADWVNITGFNVSHGGVNPLDGGIQLDSVGHCTVTGNIAYENARGFILSYTNKSTLHGNTAIRNWDYGIYVTDSTNNTIRDNKLVDNYHSGIRVVVFNDTRATYGTPVV